MIGVHEDSVILNHVVMYRHVNW